MAKKKNRKRPRSSRDGPAYPSPAATMAPSSTSTSTPLSASPSSSGLTTTCMDLCVVVPSIRQSAASAGLLVKQLLDRVEATGFTHVALTHVVYGIPQADQDCAETAIPSTLWKTASSTTSTRKIQVWRRLHAIVENASDVGFYAARKEPNVILKDYDLISVAPRNDAAFLAACTSATACEIISLDYTNNSSGSGSGGGSGLPFRIRAAPVKAALERLVRFEIMYAPAILHANQRRCIIQTSRDFQMACRSLNRSEKQRSVIFSSGDRRRVLRVAVDSKKSGGGNNASNNDVGALALRTYGDLRNLFETVLGFDDHVAASALSSAGLGAIQQGHIRRFGNASARTAIGNVAVETGDCRLSEFQAKKSTSKPSPSTAASITTAVGSAFSDNDKDKESSGPAPVKRKASAELDTGADDDEEEKVQDGFISF